MRTVPPPTARRPDPDAVQHGAVRAPTLLASFRYAFAGIHYLLWTQRNARIHAVITLAAVALGLVLRIERGDWLALALITGLVFVAEGFNTAIEAVVDLAAPGYHPLAKVAKDVAAGTVLLAAIAAVIVGMLVFLPYLLPIVLAALRRV